MKIPPVVLDIGERTGLTAASAGLGYLLTVVTPLSAPWAVLAAAVIRFALAWLATARKNTLSPASLVRKPSTHTFPATRPAKRKAGNRGRAPVKAPADRFPISWVHDYLINPLPAVTYPVDVSGGITAWGMLGNGPDPTCTTHPNGVGDCTFAGREHVKRAKAAAAGIVESWETSNQLVAEYLAYDKGQDEGAVIADLLLAWYKAGLIEAFAPVDHTNPAAVDSAMAAFHGCYVGVSLTDDADDLFERGAPWTTAQGQKPDSEDGHCIVKVKADGNTDTWVTWGALQPSTLAWTKACLDEAWVIITAEDAHLVNLAALKADIDALHGTGGDTPTPTPDPVAGGTVVVDDPALVAHLTELAAKAKESAHDFLAARLHKLYPTAKSAYAARHKA